MLRTPNQWHSLMQNQRQQNETWFQSSSFDRSSCFWWSHRATEKGQSKSKLKKADQSPGVMMRGRRVPPPEAHPATPLPPEALPLPLPLQHQPDPPPLVPSWLLRLPYCGYYWPATSSCDGFAWPSSLSLLPQPLGWLPGRSSREACPIEETASPRGE